MKKASSAQKWARRRNFAKKQLMSMRTTTARLANDKILSYGERMLLEDINQKLCRLTRQWEDKNFGSKYDFMRREKWRENYGNRS